MKNSISKDIRKALAALGVTGTVELRQIATDRIEVTVDGSYFGIWDSVRKTFVD